MAFVTILFGVTLILLLVFILSLMSRIDLLTRQIDAIRLVLQESDSKLQKAAQVILGSDAQDGNPGTKSPD